MLRLLRDRLSIVLAPHMVVLVRTSQWRRKVTAQRTISVVPDKENTWQVALSALTLALEDVAWRNTDIRVVVSNHLVRYQMLPKNTLGTKKSHNDLIIKHYFDLAYGGVAENWAFAADHRQGAGVRLATAMDRALIDALHQCCAGPKFKLVSIQPALAVAFNYVRKRLDQSQHWFVMLDANHVCLCLFQQGEWYSVRGATVSGDVRVALSEVLGREKVLAGIDGSDGEVTMISLDERIGQTLSVQNLRVKTLKANQVFGVNVKDANIALAIAA